MNIRSCKIGNITLTDRELSEYFEIDYDNLIYTFMNIGIRYTRKQLKYIKKIIKKYNELYPNDITNMFTLVKKLGEGAFGDVFYCTFEINGKIIDVAFKNGKYHWNSEDVIGTELNKLNLANYYYFIHKLDCEFYDNSICKISDSYRERICTISNKCIQFVMEYVNGFNFGKRFLGIIGITKESFNSDISISELNQRLIQLSQSPEIDNILNKILDIVFQILKQCALALYIGNITLDFIHRDTKIDNIIIIEHDQPKEIRYGPPVDQYGLNNVELIPTISFQSKYEVVMVDYGMGTIHQPNKKESIEDFINIFGFIMSSSTYKKSLS